MSEPDFGSIISSLTQEDIGRLSDMAQQLFGSAAPEPPAAPPPGEPAASLLPGGIDPELTEKLLKILPLIRQGGDSERARLIRALKPMLSQGRRKKADEALRLLRLIEILPLLGQAGIDLF